METVSQYTNNSSLSSVSDYFEDTTPEVVVDEASQAVEAAKLGVLEDGNPVDNYQSFLSKMADREYAKIEGFVTRRQAMEIEGQREELRSLLLDPDVNVNVKQAVVEAVNINGLKPPTSTTMLAQKLASLPGSMNADASQQAIEEAANFDRVLSFLQWKDAALKEQKAKTSPSTMGTILDFAELVLPFSEQSGVYSRLSELTQEYKAKGFLSEEMGIEAFTIMGELKNDVHSSLKNLPIEDRRRAMELWVDIINTSGGTFLSDSNDLVRIKEIEEVLGDEGYTIEDRVWDNFTSLMDLTGILSIPKAIKRVVGGTTTVTDDVAEVAKATHNQLKTEGVLSTSTSQIALRTNPDMAKALSDAAAKDEAVAKAVYGTNSRGAAANDHLPDVHSPDGTHRPKLSLPIEGSLKYGDKDIDENTLNFLDAVDGAIYYTEAEKAEARANTTIAFREALGEYNHAEKMTVEHTDYGLKFRTIFAPRDRGFRNAEDALDLARLRTAQLGVAEDNLVLLKNVDGEYIPVDKGAVNELPEGDYILSVAFDYRVDPETVKQASGFEHIFSKRDWAYGVGEFGKTATQTAFDPMSVIDPFITRAGLVSAKRFAAIEANLLETTKPFVDGFKSLDKTDKEGVLSFMKKALSEEIKYTRTNMAKEGLSEQQMKVLQDFRRVEDTKFWIENRFFVERLNSQGFQSYYNKANDTQVLARPMKLNGLPRHSVFAYDPVLDTTKELSRVDVERLYEGGAILGRLRGDKDAFEGAEYIISLEKSGDHFKKLSKDDMVLNYREGYYATYYTDPIFIDVTKDGVRHTVGSAKTQKEADVLIKRLQKEEKYEGMEFSSRLDANSQRTEEIIDIAISQGRMSQRRRGERLQSVDSVPTNLTNSSILDPVESLTRSIRSASMKLGYGEFLNSFEARMLSQFSEVFPKDEVTGLVRFPSSIDEIGVGASQQLKSTVNNARANFAYYEQLRKGQFAALDDTYRGLLHSLADSVGKLNIKGASTSEAALHTAAGIDPLQSLRGLGSALYLALSPLRQLVIQTSTIPRNIAVNAPYVLSGAMARDLVYMMARQSVRDKDKSIFGGVFDPSNKAIQKLMGRSEKELRELEEDYFSSGFRDAMNTNSLVFSSLDKLTSVSRTDRAFSAVKAIPRLGFQYGQGLAEKMHLTSSWLTHRDKAIRAKGSSRLTNVEKDQIIAAADNFAGAMNRAGDVAYTRGSLGFILQYMTFPHKMLLQGLTNRQLSKAEKLKLVATDVLLYGTLGGTIGASLLDQMGVPTDSPEYEVIHRGLIDAFVNNTVLEALDVRTNFNIRENFAPYDLAGFMELFKELGTTPTGEMVAESPAGSLFFGGNARITNAAKTFLRFTIPPLDPPYSETTYQDVLRDVAYLSSGASAAHRAYIVLTEAKKLSGTGRTIVGGIEEGEVTPMAIATALGFQSMEEVYKYETLQKSYKSTKELEKAVKMGFDEFRRKVAYEGITPEEIGPWLDRFGLFVQGFREGAERRYATEYAWKLMERDSRDSKDSVFKAIVKLADIGKAEEAMNMVDRMVEAGAMTKENKELIEFVIKGGVE